MQGNVEGEWLNGHVSAARRAPGGDAATPSWLYSVSYDAGDEGHLLTSRKLRPLVVFGVGETVEVNDPATKRWAPGVIGAANENGTYDIKFSDGSTQPQVRERTLHLPATEQLKPIS